MGWPEGVATCDKWAFHLVRPQSFQRWRWEVVVRRQASLQAHLGHLRLEGVESIPTGTSRGIGCFAG